MIRTCRSRRRASADVRRSRCSAPITWSRTATAFHLQAVRRPARPAIRSPRGRQACARRPSATSAASSSASARTRPARGRSSARNRSRRLAAPQPARLPRVALVARPGPARPRPGAGAACAAVAHAAAAAAARATPSSTSPAAISASARSCSTIARITGLSGADGFVGARPCPAVRREVTGEQARRSPRLCSRLGGAVLVTCCARRRGGRCEVVAGAVQLVLLEMDVAAVEVRPAPRSWSVVEQRDRPVERRDRVRAVCPRSICSRPAWPCSTPAGARRSMPSRASASRQSASASSPSPGLGEDVGQAGLDPRQRGRRELRAAASFEQAPGLRVTPPRLQRGDSRARGGPRGEHPGIMASASPGSLSPPSMRLGQTAVSASSTCPAGSMLADHGAAISAATTGAANDVPLQSAKPPLKSSGSMASRSRPSSRRAGHRLESALEGGGHGAHHRRPAARRSRHPVARRC